MTDDFEARRAMIRARAHWVLNQPFLASLVLRLRLLATRSIPKAATDGRWLLINPDFAETLNEVQLQGIVAHETMHCVYRHQHRRKHRDPLRWNIACDFAINRDLIEIGVTLPDDVLYDKQYDGLSAEQIYELLPRIVTLQMQESAEGNGWVEDADSLSEGADQEEKEKGGPGMSSEAKDKPQQWKEWSVSAVNMAKSSPGSVPTNAVLEYGRLSQPQVDWRAALARFLSVQNVEPSWTRPNRRTIASGLYLPSNKTETIGDILVAVDTSGSVVYETGLLTQFMSELNGILNHVCPSRCTLVYCDAGIAYWHTFTQSEMPIGNLPKPVGGGGTSPNPVWNLVKEEKLEPQCIVYLTDLEMSFGEDPDICPILWVSTKRHTESSYYTPPEYGEIVVMEHSAE